MSDFFEIMNKIFRSIHFGKRCTFQKTVFTLKSVFQKFNSYFTLHNNCFTATFATCGVYSLCGC